MADIGNIYEIFRQGETWSSIPFVAVPNLDTDKQTTYIPGQSLLTKISNFYYGNPYMGKFILAANPEVGPDEFAIEEEVSLRIPFPLDIALQYYKNELQIYLNT